MPLAPTRPAPAAFIKHAADVASFYGFRHARDWDRVAREAGAPARGRTHTFATVSSVCVTCVSAKQEPALAWWASAAPSHIPAPGAEADMLGEFGLHIAGTPESVGEVVLLKTVTAILSEWGAPAARMRLNTLGDRDSKARYARELSYYFRRHQDELCPSCRSAIAADPFAPFACQEETCRSAAESGPRAMNFLSEKSRSHFRSVLEHIERLGLSYELDDLLVADDRESQLLFSVDLGKPDATVVTVAGGRFDDHVRKLSGRKDATGLSASVFFRKTGLSPASFSQTPSLRAPRVFFVQLGLQAKLQGLFVIDELRRAQVPVLQTFDTQKLAPQLSAAKAAGVSHLIIMGQREALDGTVIVREVDNSAQTVVALGQLPRFLKTLR